MPAFEPQFVFFEPQALDYPLGQQLYQRFQTKGIPIQMTTSHNQVRGIPGDTPLQAYKNAKRTLVVGVRKTLTFDTSKPSAEYAIPLATGCMGHCHYCYLQTTMGAKPYIRVYVNVDEILKQAEAYIKEREPEITRFEAACTSDIVGIDHLTHTLFKTIEFMGRQRYGRLRFVTKYHHVDHLLKANHNQHTRFRFSINADYVIKHFEPGTSALADRIEAAKKVARAGYPLGFVIAPIMRYEAWQNGYASLLRRLSSALADTDVHDLTFELIMHRFTKAAKRIILERYPKTKLDMKEEERKYKWGRYGRGKYVYRDEQAQDLNTFIREQIDQYFPQAKIEYFT
ncbi:spore photoproduct lyase [Caldalkalibacillus uzonensis]|uniref:spore photoproduct lyase n=1 Tax=Caldalkalibacillus uzonensis TaxID=353224 RepID=UPI0027D911A8|nr:spore photoproduct lyase [Caldalkalibacillus uzonensis]